MHTRPEKRQSKMAGKFDQIESKKKIVHDFKHDQMRESLSSSAQFNCEGCNG